jgi:hypothetical protein
MYVQLESVFTKQVFVQSAYFIGFCFPNCFQTTVKLCEILWSEVSKGACCTVLFPFSLKRDSQEMKRHPPRHVFRNTLRTQMSSILLSSAWGS